MSRAEMTRSTVSSSRKVNVTCKSLRSSATPKRTRFTATGDRLRRRHLQPENQVAPRGQRQQHVARSLQQAASHGSLVRQNECKVTDIPTLPDMVSEGAPQTDPWESEIFSGYDMKTKHRSPIKDAPLRSPGQSLEEEKRRILADLEGPFLFAGGLCAIALFEWIRAISERPPSPILFTLVAAIAVSYLLYRKRCVTGTLLG